MERLISEEERIRRAEDILERRKNTDLRISSENFVKEKSNKKIKKMLIQILICLLIYCGIYYVKNSQNENLKSFLNNINGVLEYDVDFKKIYDQLCKNLNILKNNEENIDQTSTENADENQNTEADKSQNSDTSENINENNQQESENLNLELTQEDGSLQTEQSLSMGIGGSTEEVVEPISNVLTEGEQMKVDADYIKQNFSIINPLTTGIVTSRFGTRESTEIVSANHKGIDLGATTGTIIVAAMEGTVIEASSEGDFGLHLKIANGDVTVIYAHCSELLVKEGDKITQGKEIAKVGSTGKATGPHLHFEIRRENRAVNPEYLLQF